MKSTFLSFLGVAMTMATMALATNVRDTRGSISVRHGGSKRSGISSEDLEQMGDQMAARANLNLRFNYGRDMSVVLALVAGLSLRISSRHQSTKKLVMTA